MATEPNPDNTPDPVWFRVLESKVVATLITVLVGGLLVQLILTDVQNKADRRKMAFTAYENRLSEGSDHIKKSFSDAGAVIGAAENLAGISKPDWNPELYEGDRADRVRDKRSSIVAKFNDVAFEWQSLRESNALVMGYFLNAGNVDFAHEWRSVESVIDGFITCAKQCYGRTIQAEDPVFEDCDCDPMKQKAWAAVSEFNRLVEANRKYVDF